MSKKIYLSPSVQVNNKYAYGNTTECIQCERIAAAAASALKRCGFEVKVNTTRDMYKAVAESDAWGADLHVPIHTNACNGQVTGTRMFYYSEGSEGYKACKAIYNVLAPLTLGTSENYSAYPGLYELRKPKAPAAYIEVDFHDVARIAKWIIEHVNDIGEAICKGICNHYGVTYKPPVVDNVNNADKLYRVQVGAYGVKANADAMLKRLKAAGFDGYIVESKK